MNTTLLLLLVACFFVGCEAKTLRPPTVFKPMSKEMCADKQECSDISDCLNNKTCIAGLCENPICILREEACRVACGSVNCLIQESNPLGIGCR